jgi:hypothetical protein
MTVETWTVGIVVDKRPLKSIWQPFAWVPSAALVAAPQASAWTPLAADGAVERFYAGPATLTLYPGETETYRHNLESAVPSVYVVLRKDESERGLGLLLATVDAGEAHAHADTGDDIVEPVPLAPEIHAWMSEFVARHHVERVRYKRQRERADPEALATGRHLRPASEDEDG